MKRSLAIAISAAAVLMGLTACSNPELDDTEQQSGSQDVVTTVEKDDEIAAMLPDSYKDKGFTAAINANIPPVKFVDDSGDITGLNPELLRAAARVLGIEVTFKEVTFDALVPGLESKRYDVIASVGDYVERQKHIDFIDYLQNGTAIIATTDFEKDKVKPADLCGLSIGYTRGTSQQANLEAANEECAAAGEPAIKINAYQDGGAGVLSVKSGEADGFWGDLPPMAYNVRTDSDMFKLIYTEQDSVVGIGIHKDNAEFRDALRAALLKLVDNGVYDKLLDQWGLADFGVPTMDINSENSIGEG
ncbi:ABC transporter substrate-binding protein [Microbacterium sp. MPKO10]|uniref:ABC transporter substrate-binding protein n=1 Tax=Microbacterium sp. MPKO10 TaxID=2989818 RepID=UPI002235BB9E|nr:ABC transporter substrate-binding protein [Microbacterium sp. MPKO10]MCW4459869.1 ABC transporter substrate-binding protein [Microbacterium sp. MPKO10]